MEAKGELRCGLERQKRIGSASSGTERHGGKGVAGSVVDAN